MVMGTVRGWAELQHYKDRSPPWIKLHRKLIDNFDFCCLPVASKALAPLIWLLAAETNDGTVNLDPEWLAFRLRWSADDVRAGLTPLIDKGFLEAASGVLAECLQPATPEREREREGETEREAEVEKSASADQRPYPEILDAYHEILPGCQQVAVLNDKRRKRIAAIVKLARRVCAEQGWDYDADQFWRAYFTECATDPWMRGEVPNPRNPAWKQNLDVLLAEDRFAGVMDRAIASMRGDP